MTTEYRIYPPIGIARLGEDDDFFLAPEFPAGPRGELQPDGSTIPVTRYKDATRTRVRKQAVRFHLFQSEDGEAWVPATLPPGAVVTWRVRLVNKKSAVRRPNSPPELPQRPVVPAANAGQVIDGGTRAVAGPDATSAPFMGTFATTATNGTPYTVSVHLGALRTDARGRLIVLGGNGFSSAPPGTPLGGSYYNNPGWHDDVADGPVTAEIRLAPDQPPVMASGGAWVIIAPPDYAPAIECPVTLFDVIRQVGIDSLGATAPSIPSFEHDILPIIRRVRRLRWVHADERWADPALMNPNLGNRGAEHKAARAAARDIVGLVEQVFVGHTSTAGPPYELREHQRAQIASWVDGAFDDTLSPASSEPTAAGLTRAALDGAAGQGFCPGIEAGILILEPTIYDSPFDFRISHTSLEAGDLTALMALPWQADFLKCSTEWWPTQRPDFAPQNDGSMEEWMRGIGGHKALVRDSGRLGFIVQVGDDEVFLENERDPSLK